ncbi:MAG: hypothetical protein HC904_07145 [Blastochloris sp.]|nr:hypothetical protein [Blastochloris sp.]
MLKDFEAKKQSSGPNSAKPKPNILFLVFDHKLSNEISPLRYRILNGISGTPITLNPVNSEKVTIEPGAYHELTAQKPVETISVTIGEKNYPVFMNQQGLARNALIIFYRTADGPAFMRAFENTQETFKSLEDLETSEARP